MAQKSKQWAAIIMMIALFAMIAFVTNLCSPMATIVKNQFGASETAGQIGNYANFIAYLLMGIPSGMLITKMGYKKTALAALMAVAARPATSSSRLVVHSTRQQPWPFTF